MKTQFRIRTLVFMFLAMIACATPAQAATKILLIAGPGSHGYGAHEFRAGSLLLANELEAAGLDLEVIVSEGGWPSDKSVFDDVATVVMMCTGEDKHLLNQKLEFFDALASKGVGLVNLHTSVITTKGRAGDYFLKWTGGYHELYYSMVAHWVADFQSLPDHPVARGVKPFVFNDEWYYFMRFTPGMKGVTPILSAHPNPADAQKKKPGKLGGGDEVRAAVANREIQHVAWAFEREGPGRGFGFTGGHDHWYFADPNYRKLVLNAICWTANVPIPDNGVSVQHLTINDLLTNQDDRPAVGMTLDGVLEKYPVDVTTPATDINFTPRLPLQWRKNTDTIKIAFVAGTRSGDFGQLEQYATCTLLGNELEAAFPTVDVQVFAHPYPKDMYDQLVDAAAVVFYPNDAKANPFDKGAKPIREWLTGRAGIVAMATGLAATEAGGGLLHETLGARGVEGQATYRRASLAFSNFPAHAVSRGLKAFNVVDDWLGPLEVSESIGHAVIILKDEHHAPLLWLNETPTGKRRVGFAGGNQHFSFSNAMYRKVTLNAIAWAAGLTIPKSGVQTNPLSFDELSENLNHELPVYIDKEKFLQSLRITP